MGKTRATYKDAKSAGMFSTSVQKTSPLHQNIGAITPHSQTQLRFNCSNMDEIELICLLGVGWFKAVFRGQHGNEPVAVKMVAEFTQESEACDNSKNKMCNADVKMRMMKEILLFSQFSHPNLIQLLGYCVRGNRTRTLTMRDQGMMAVYEMGETATKRAMLRMSWQLRLQNAIEIADLLHYLQYSPLGSVLLRDGRKIEQFLIKDGHIKLSDLDSITTAEPNCFPNNNSSCGFKLPCVIGKCNGYNAHENLRLFCSTLLWSLLSTKDEKQKQVINRMKGQVKQGTISAASLKINLLKMAAD